MTGGPATGLEQSGSAQAGLAPRRRSRLLAGFRKSIGPSILPFEWCALIALLLLTLALDRLPVRYNLPLVARIAFLTFILTFFQTLLGFVLLHALLAALRSPRGGRLAYCWGRVKAMPYATRQFWTDSVRVAAALWAVLGAHFLVKISIRLLNPKVFDPWLWRYDRLLGFGCDPVLALVAWLRWPPLLHAIDVVYSVLYSLVFLTYLALCVIASPTRALRVSAVTGFCLLWVAGAALYVAFPSWGPVYTQPAHFEATLSHMPITYYVQKQLFQELKALFDNPLGPRPVRYGGVAAFPSLHLAVCTLFFLATWRINRPWAFLNAVLWAVMFVGSMVSGYHYLSDSLAGTVLGAACYLGALRWTSWTLGRAIPASPPSGGLRQTVSPQSDIPRPGES